MRNLRLPDWEARGAAWRALVPEAGCSLVRVECGLLTADPICVVSDAHVLNLQPSMNMKLLQNNGDLQVYKMASIIASDPLPLTMHNGNVCC